MGAGAGPLHPVTDAAVHDCEPLPAKSASVFCLMARHQPSRGRYDSPPRQSPLPSEHVSHRSSRAGEARLFGHFTVGSDLSLSQSSDDSAYLLLELGVPVKFLPSHHSPRIHRPGSFRMLR